MSAPWIKGTRQKSRDLWKQVLPKIQEFKIISKFDLLYKGFSRQNLITIPKSVYYNWSISAVLSVWSCKSIMKRYMRQPKINFFESPHPQHFQPFAHNHLIYETHNLADYHEDPLFNSPFRTTPQSSFLKVDHYQITSQQPQEEVVQPQGSLQDSDRMENQQSQFQTPAQIHQKIQFSQQQDQQEDLLVALTPQHPAHMAVSELDNVSTVRRRLQYSSQPALSVPGQCERGLKKLSDVAYAYVLSQKRTTYKDVAKKMIGQLSDDGEIDLQKKCQMNVKRRVYDALNVLIALGLLRRNGNRIMARRTEDKILSSTTFEENKLTRCETKEEQLTEQKDYLKRIIQEKEKVLIKKRQMVQALQRKLESIKTLTHRNMTKNVQSEEKLQMPLLFLASKNQSQTPIEHPKGSLKLTLPSFDEVAFTFPVNSIQVIGDLDAISQINMPVQQEKKVKNKRNRSYR